MAEFLKAINMLGFDRYQTPRWQMVPWLGVRYVILRDGAGLTVASANSVVCAVTEVKQTDLPPGSSGHERTPLLVSDRVFLLFGVWTGNTLIQATGGPGAVDLEVDVKMRKTVRITFNFVEDSASPKKHHTRRVPAQAKGWVDTMNYIYNGQANIEIISKEARWVTVPKNLGATVETLSNGPGEEVDIYPLGDSGADVNMFLVWDMDITDDPADEDAFTEGKNIVFEDNAGRFVGVTMSHEFGHSQGLKDQYLTKRELMYGITDQRGFHLPKEHVNIINK
jgi:hypothetical protein